MNKNLKICLGLASMLLVACADDGISESESLAENWPSDFNVAEYSMVNPDIANFQRKQAVAQFDSSYVNKIRNDSIAVWMISLNRDSVVQQVATKNPNDVADAAKMDSLVTAAINSSMKTKANKISVSFDSLEQNIFFSDENAAIAIFTEYAGIDPSYWPGVDAIRNGSAVVGKNPTDYLTALAAFHCFGNTAAQDLQFLQSVKIDSNLIKMHYNLIGRYEGLAYRYCRITDQIYPKYQGDWSVEDETIVQKVYSNRDVPVLDSLGNQVMDSTPLPHKMFVYQKEVVVDTVSDGSPKIDSLLLEGYELKDSILYSFKPKVQTVKDSTETSITKRKYVDNRKPNSARAESVDASVGVWDFSADEYCLEKTDGKVYIIVQ